MSRWAAFRGKMSMDNKDFIRPVQQSSKEVQKFASESKKGFDGSSKSAKQLSTEIAAMVGGAIGGIALVVNELKELETELLQTQYAFDDMGRAGRKAVEGIVREQAKITGSSTLDVARVSTALATQGIDSRTARGRHLINVVSNFADATGKDHSGIIDVLGTGNVSTGATYRNLLDVYTAGGRHARGGLRGGFDLLGQFMPALAPAGTALGLDEGDLAGLLSTASWHTPRARRAGSGLRMILEEAVKPDSKFAKNFSDTFNMSLIDAISGRGAAGLTEAFERAMTAWGDQGFISSFGSAETGSLALALTKDNERLDKIMDAVENSSGAAERINEQYEGTLKQTQGVLTATFNDLKYAIANLFEDDAISWMTALTEIMEDDNLVKAAGDFLAAATAISEPLREVAIPLSQFTAALLSFEVPTLNEGMSIIELMTYGWLGGRAGRLAAGGTKGLAAGKTGKLLTKAGFGGVLKSAGVSAGASATGYLMLGLLANEVLEAATGFDVLDESVSSLQEVLDMAGNKISSIDWTPGQHGSNVIPNFRDQKWERYQRQLDYWMDTDLVKRLDLSEQDLRDVYTSLYPSQDGLPHGIGVYASHATKVSDYLKTLEADLYLFDVRVKAASDALKDLAETPPPPPMGMYQAAQLGVAQMAPTGFDPRAALRFAAGLAPHAPGGNLAVYRQASKDIEKAFRADGMLSNQERGMLASIDMWLSDLAGNQRRTAEATEGTEANTAPQRDYRVQLAPIVSADQLLVGG